MGKEKHFVNNAPDGEAQTTGKGMAGEATCGYGATAIMEAVRDFLREEERTVKEEGLISFIKDAISEKTLISTKEVLTSEEAARYLGVGLGYLYKLTNKRELPYYKPSGKLCFFNRRELEAWLQRNRISSKTEIADRAFMIAMKGGKR